MCACPCACVCARVRAFSTPSRPVPGSLVHCGFPPNPWLEKPFSPAGAPLRSGRLPRRLHLPPAGPGAQASLTCMEGPPPLAPPTRRPARHVHTHGDCESGIPPDPQNDPRTHLPLPARHSTTCGWLCPRPSEPPALTQLGWPRAGRGWNKPCQPCPQVCPARPHLAGASPPCSWRGGSLLPTFCVPSCPRGPDTQGEGPGDPTASQELRGPEGAEAGRRPLALPKGGGSLPLPPAAKCRSLEGGQSSLVPCHSPTGETRSYHPCRQRPPLAWGPRPWLDGEAP